MALMKDKRQELAWELSQNIIKIIKWHHLLVADNSRIVDPEDLPGADQTNVTTARKQVTWLKIAQAGTETEIDQAEDRGHLGMREVMAEKMVTITEMSQVMHRLDRLLRIREELEGTPR